MNGRSLWVEAALLTWASCLSPQNTITPELPVNRQPLDIGGISIVDVSTGKVQKQRTIHIERGRIIAVSDASQTSVRKEATEIDGRGKFLITGLWDAHVHEEPGRFLPLYLHFGVTSVIDKGGYLKKLIALRSAVADGRETGPRLFMAGRPLDGDPPKWPSSYADVPIIVRNEVKRRRQFASIGGRAQAISSSTEAWRPDDVGGHR